MFLPLTWPVNICPRRRRPSLKAAQARSAARLRVQAPAPPPFLWGRVSYLEQRCRRGPGLCGVTKRRRGGAFPMRRPFAALPLAFSFLIHLTRCGRNTRARPRRGARLPPCERYHVSHHP